jgi:CheY-like chemotaxis protein
MRIVVCDDDVDMRAIVTSLAEGRGHSVIAETDNAADARRLIERFGADVLILDLSLRLGGARELLSEFVGDAGPCPIVVFSAFSGDVRADYPGIVFVDKPDFPGLEAELDRLAAQPARPEGLERRHEPSHGRAVPQRPSAREDLADEFFRALDLAEPGDTLLAVTALEAGAIDPISMEALAGAAVRSVRVQDHVIQEPSCVVLFLVGGAPGTSEIVLQRIRSHIRLSPSVVWAVAQLDGREPPADAFVRVIREVRRQAEPEDGV